ncbi:uncharacterized protein RHOBADRAFT_46346 [Rhodotorula graminis WP1]|uniref:UBC core domain-containing protein n=1 Tax=Rhodotorula graminis (strain WP1) TaxID=578459 RepID=A0A0P9EHH3_RHOGW|nr:uncharacterized protein RHOBADRAFT_46346 [Rhodotorula graminis WP1]KPV72751.1 hypothetical protein RHOBADRAFT_46346 [Rhodotorula graminis WP1]
MVTPKRERSLSLADDNPPRTASRALRDAIQLVSTSSPLDISPALDAQLLVLLSDAVTLTTALEDRELEHDRKRVKLEHASVEPAAALARAADAPPRAGPPVAKAPMPSFYGLDTVQGALSDAEYAVLHDVEAGLPLLDTLGILLRPVKSHDDGKVNLLEWEALFPVKAPESNWRGAFFQPRVIFSDNYPSQPPKVKLAPSFFHPNVWPSGTVAPSWPERQAVADTWSAELLAVYGALGLKGRIASRNTPHDVLVKVPEHLRLPLYLEACRAVLTSERLDEPASLEAWSTIKKEPAKYRSPTSTDLAHLADAAARAEWRTENGLDLPLDR